MRCSFVPSVWSRSRPSWRRWPCWLGDLRPAVNAAVADDKPAAAKKLLAVEDLYLFDAPRAVALAPDGKSAVYVRHWIDAQRKAERFSLWRVDGSRTRPRRWRTGEPDARAPVFSPDGKWIAFLSTRPRPKGWKQTPPVPPRVRPRHRHLADPRRRRRRPSRSPARRSPTAASSTTASTAGSPSRPTARGSSSSPTTATTRARPRRSSQRRRRSSAPTRARATPATARPRSGSPTSTTKPGKFAADADRAADGRRRLVRRSAVVARRQDARRPRQPHRRPRVGPLQHQQELRPLGHRRRPRGKLRQLTHGPGPGGVAALLARRQADRLPERPAQGLAPRRVQPGRRRRSARSEPTVRVLFDHHGPDADKPPHPPPSFPLPDDCWDGDDHLVYNAEAGTDTATVRVDLRDGQGRVAAAEERRKPATAAPTARTRPAADAAGQRASCASGCWRRAKVDHLEERRGHDDRRRADAAAARAWRRPPYKLIVYPHGGPHSRSALGFDFTVAGLRGATATRSSSRTSAAAPATARSSSTPTASTSAAATCATSSPASTT